jgi:multidrug efflux pump
MNISELCIRRPVFASVLSMMLVIFGVVALERLRFARMPGIFRGPWCRSAPPIVVPAASVVENQVTQAIEDRVAGAIERVLETRVG